MQATRKRLKEEQVKQSVSNQSKFFMPVNSRLRVSDVYNDSDSDSDNESITEESSPPSHQASKSPAEACRKTDDTD
ncbi:hypothetical protein TNCT_209001 [Trichonephila clavata]|uniref:Uncharacterized protein n=1 Tax=Trichonephila clavata TaxID=2740835 RepID=A0A8X6H9M8_TRICU|nr:hypothetical protein TNCT_209001 [Trichonephila clavata]